MMRRALVAVAVALTTATATGALVACGGDRSDDAAPDPTASSPPAVAPAVPGDTESLCAATQAAGEPEMAEFQSGGIALAAALGSEDGPAAEEALAQTQQAGARLAGTFRDHAAAADDPEFAAGLIEMAEAVEQLADDFAAYDPLDSESIPDITAFDQAGQAMLEFCDDW